MLPSGPPTLDLGVSSEGGHAEKFVAVSSFFLVFACPASRNSKLKLYRVSYGTTAFLLRLEYMSSCLVFKAAVV